MDKILVVDDNQELVEGLKLTLEMEGFAVLTASSGYEALEVLKYEIPDLILADIMMPNLDGYELYIRVHRNPQWMRIPFIFLTARTSQEDIRKGTEMGADGYITKPFDPQDVVATIRGKLKRATELNHGAADDIWPHVKYVLQGKVAFLPVPVLILLLTAALVSLPVILMRPSPSSFPSPETSTTLQSDTSELLEVPAGEFTMGGPGYGAVPPHLISLPGYQIDRYEVTMKQYQDFVAVTNHTAPWDAYSQERADLPVTNISWDEARDYCAWVGGRLPTEAEWEKAARGTDGRAYPWGNSWQDNLANTEEANAGGVKSVGSYPQGASPYEVEDMAGNVWEWTSDWYDAEKLGRVIRGGAWNDSHNWAQTFARNQLPPQTHQENVGFRCVCNASQ